MINSSEVVRRYLLYESEISSMSTVKSIDSCGRFCEALGVSYQAEC
jgi:hypothetical protein